MTKPLSVPPALAEADARRAHCWFDVDRVPRDPATTTWKRSARWGQARWRAARGHPIGFHPYRGGPDSTRVGSRLDLTFARDSGANFISAGALAAVRSRLGERERFEMLREDRLWADLLSSMPMCFNLFGDLAEHGDAAKSAVRGLWPDARSGDVRVRFEHSPGRRDPEFLGNQSAFDVAFDIDDAGGSRGIVGVETKYHEHALQESRPKPAALARYIEVTDRSGVFAGGWRERIIGTDLQQIWLDHLLVLAMLQHPSKRWAWGRFVLVYPAANPSFASAVVRYSACLAGRSTFAGYALEDVVAVLGSISSKNAEAFRERYLWWTR